jgi:hypothetical protein
MGDMAVLFPPVGQLELDLIEASGWRAFPPRLDWQPIFYPALTEEYAAKIARDGNTKVAANGSVGYVLRFEADDDYLTGHQVHEVGGRACREYWIAAEQVDDFNRHIVGGIEVIAEYRG